MSLQNNFYSISKFGRLIAIKNDRLASMRIAYKNIWGIAPGADKGKWKKQIGSKGKIWKCREGDLTERRRYDIIIRKFGAAATAGCYPEV